MGRNQIDLIGIISDPHGCLVGLRAALDWLEAEGVETIACAGDVANFGPQPNECISLLIERKVACTQGNCDRNLLLPHPTPRPTSERNRQLSQINNWGKLQLTEFSREWLASLPPRLEPAPGVLIVHGGIDDLDEIVDHDADLDFPQGISVVVAGHLHRPFINPTRGGTWVNAGSAGASCDFDTRAAVAVLENGPDEWKPSIHRIQYDLEEAARAIRQAEMPYAERIIEVRNQAVWWKYNP